MKSLQATTQEDSKGGGERERERERGASRQGREGERKGTSEESDERERRREKDGPALIPHSRIIICKLESRLSDS